MARGLRGADGRLTASLSLDLDNLWSYKKTHGDADWVDLPSYTSVIVPRLIEVFGEADLKATVFIVGQDAELDRDRGEGVLGDIVKAGHEVGNHSFSHEPWLHLYERSRLEEEIDRTTAGVLEVTGVQPTGFRGPGYSLSLPLLEHLQRRGYDYDASTLPTWIGPLARAYYFRSAGLTPEQREQRKGLFGSTRDVLRAQRPYQWDLGGQGRLLEIPVTVWPFARVPFHLSYVLQLHAINPRLAWAYVDAATRVCNVVGLGPSILLHPLDLLGPDDAPGLQFFPGMSLAGSEKVSVARRLLALLGERFDVVPMGVHARRLAEAGAMKVRQPVRLSPGD